MAILKTTQVTNMNRNQIPSGDRATDLVPIFGDYTLLGTEATNDILEAIPFPANHQLVDLYVDTDDLGTAVTADVGIMSGAFLDTGARTCGAEIMTGKALGTAGAYRADVAGFSRIAASATDRSIGVKLSSVSVPTASAKLRVNALFRPIWEGV